MEMFYRWRKLWLIVLAVLIANSTPEAKAFPMQNISTTTFPTPINILPSKSISKASSMSNTSASKIPSTPYESQSPTLSPTITTRSIAVNSLSPTMRPPVRASSMSNTPASKIPSTPYESQSPTLSPTITTRSIAVNSLSPTMRPPVRVSSMSNTPASKIPSTPYESQSPTLSPTVTTRSIAVNSSSPTMKPPVTASSMSNTPASKIPSTPYESQSPTLSPTITTRSIAVNSLSPTMRPPVRVSSMSNTPASKIPSTPYESQSPTLSPTVTTRSIAVNSSSPTMKPPVTGSWASGSGGFKLIKCILIGIGVLAVIIIIVVVLCKLRRRPCPRTPKSSIRSFHRSGCDQNPQFEHHEDTSNHSVCLGVQEHLSSTSQTNFGIAMEDICLKADSKDKEPCERIRAKNIITVDGATLETDSATLKIGPGCLGEETEITMLIDNNNFEFKSLVELGLLSCYPRVIEFLPDGLKFKKPADLTVQLEDVASPEQELFVLHGSYDSEMERNIWKVLTDDINMNVNGRCVDMKINGFCFYTYIMAKRGKLANLLSHLNHSFDCHAVSLYRRMPSSPYVDIAMVLVSEFVENPSEITKLINEGFRKGEIGTIKRVDTHRSLEMCLEFPELADKESHRFKIEVSQFDKDGMVIDFFREITQAFPAKGNVKVHEIRRSREKLLWTLNIREEIVEKPVVAIKEVSFVESDPTADSDDSLGDGVVMRTTKLGGSEINRLSRTIGVDWDSLAGLMDIPYEDREEMRSNVTRFTDCSSKAVMILSKFNESKGFCRDLLKKFLMEIGRHDLIKKMKSQQTDEPQSPINGDYSDNNIESEVQLRSTRLSSREMYRLSRYIIDWTSLAGLMDIAMPDQHKIRGNHVTYPDAQSQAEKVLSIFNNRGTFSREKLAEHFKDIGHHDLVNVMKTGEYRGFEVVQL